MNIKTIIICTLIAVAPIFAAPVSSVAKAVGKAVATYGDDAAKAVSKALVTYGDDAAKAASKAVATHGDDAAKAVSKVVATHGDDVAKAGGKAVATHGDDAMKAAGKAMATHGDDATKTIVKVAAHGDDIAKAAKSSTQAVVAVSGKTAGEVAELALKRSGRMLTPALKKTTEEAIARASRQYGDDVLKVVANGVQEAIEQGAKHGEAFWRLGAQVPEAARRLTLNADDLLPIAKRIGPDFLKLEARAPGLGMKAVAAYSDDAVKYIVKLPVKDAADIIAYGAKTDSQKTLQLLLKTYEKSGSAILKHLNGPRIIAYGLTSSMVITAWRLTGTVDREVDKMIKAIEKKPEAVENVVKRGVTLASLPFVIIPMGFMMIVGYLVLPIGKWLRTRLTAQRCNQP